MKKESKLYIAYGSNLNLEQMKQRCPTAEVAGKAELEGWTMVFRGSSGAVATIEREEGASVPVLVWRIHPTDEAALDVYEGYPHLYRKETMSVELDGETVEAMIYIMNDGYPLGRPSTAYYRIIRKGYESAGFDMRILETFVFGIAQNDDPLTDKVREQILAIRASGKTNMFDVKTVQYLAYRRGYFELACFVDDYRKEYVDFILTGEES